jgi:hypothetical protein
MGVAFGALLFFVVLGIHRKHLVAGDADAVNQNFRLVARPSVLFLDVFQGGYS